MSSPTRERILESTIAGIRVGAPVTLESAAEQAGLTKPGLMYHFPTKEALMLALIDHVTDRWADKMVARLGMPYENATVADRIRAYVEIVLTTEADPTDMVLMLDPRLRAVMAERWNERIGPWLTVPEELPAAQRATLITVRMIGDGAWFAGVSGIMPPSAEERDQIWRVTRRLLEEIS